MKVSVIVPIYNVERFIRRCVVSLMEQTLREVEYIFVDDASQDASIAILEEVIKLYPERIGQVQIVHHEKNKGLPAARNTGMSLAHGEYIHHCDSDDYMENNMLEMMYNAASAEDADFAWCDWFLTYENSERMMMEPADTLPKNVVTSMLLGVMKYNVWNKLVKRSIYADNQINFPSGFSMGEDMTMICLAACASTVCHIPTCLYHYNRTNVGAITQSYSEKRLQELVYNVDRTIVFLQGHISLSAEEIAFFKLSIKRPFLISEDRLSYQIWASLYREADPYIKKNTRVSVRSRFLELMALNEMWGLILFYNIVVYRFLYRWLYRSV